MSEMHVQLILGCICISANHGGMSPQTWINSEKSNRAFIHLPLPNLTSYVRSYACPQLEGPSELTKLQPRMDALNKVSSCQGAQVYVQCRNFLLNVWTWN